MTLRNAFNAIANEAKQDEQISLLELLSATDFASKSAQDIAAGILSEILLAIGAGRQEAGHGSDGANRSYVDAQDVFTAGEVLLDQTGNGGVLTFTFAAPVDLLWVRCVGGIGRADPFGGTPTISRGVYCADDEPAPLTIATDTVSVFAPQDAVVSVWGYRYG